MSGSNISPPIARRRHPQTNRGAAGEEGGWVGRAPAGDGNAAASVWTAARESTRRRRRRREAMVGIWNLSSRFGCVREREREGKGRVAERSFFLSFFFFVFAGKRRGGGLLLV
jgi:hypothetical protein